MPPYADLDSVAAQLGDPAPSGDGRLDELDAFWSAWIDEQTGRSWKGVPTTSARSVPGRGGAVLPLPVPVVAVTAVSVGGVPLAGGAYVRTLLTEDGEAWALARTDGGAWPLDGATATVTVTAQWADALSTSPPADVVEAVGSLVRYTALADKEGPTGVMGPDGRELRLPDPTQDRRVADTVRRWAIKSWVPA